MRTSGELNPQPNAYKADPLPSKSPSYLDCPEGSESGSLLLHPRILRYICKSPEEGATTVTHACVGGPINDSGTLYYANCREDIPHPMTEDLATQQTLLASSLTLLKKYYDDIPHFLKWVFFQEV
ncbi:uncharacterized protein LOC113465927 [Diaphorina citri]|uniref:Uncharacterized protein LOC113465927 n=1 Tax=Diaphorina citri TaxID=121845 RepID=A0A3Q0IKC4_DIACI|nr:uncharacterized protein LOC113465927 [Diaphorina citri]